MYSKLDFNALLRILFLLFPVIFHVHLQKFNSIVHPLYVLRHTIQKSAGLLTKLAFIIT